MFDTILGQSSRIVWAKVRSNLLSLRSFIDDYPDKYLTCQIKTLTTSNLVRTKKSKNRRIHFQPRCPQIHIGEHSSFLNPICIMSSAKRKDSKGETSQRKRARTTSAANKDNLDLPIPFGPNPPTAEDRSVLFQNVHNVQLWKFCNLTAAKLFLQVNVSPLPIPF